MNFTVNPLIFATEKIATSRDQAIFMHQLSTLLNQICQGLNNNITGSSSDYVGGDGQTHPITSAPVSVSSADSITGNGLSATPLLLVNDVVTPGLGQAYMYRNGAKRWAQPNVFNVLDYGADNSGATDSTAAINNAIAAMPSLGGSLYFPAGTYKVSSTISLNKPGIYFGDGKAFTYITTTSQTADILSIQQSGVTIQDFTINVLSGVIRTGGWHINCGNGFEFNRVTRCSLLQVWFGIYDNWIDGEISYITITMVSSSSVGIQVVATAGIDVDIHHLLVSQTTTMGTGILVNQGGVRISHSSLVHCTTALLIQATAAKLIVEAVYVDNCFFDTGGTGIYISAPLASANVDMIHIDNCWSATNTNYGLLCATSSGGKVGGVTCSNCFFGNNSSHGVLLNDAGCIGIKFIGCTMAANTGTGIFLNTGASQVIINACQIGPTGEFLGNGNYGIVCQGSNANCIITSNFTQGNTGGGGLYTGLVTSIQTNNL